MEEEEKESRDYFGHGIRLLILVWALSVMTLGYMERIRLDTFAAGLVGNIASAYGISIKGKNGNQKKPPPSPHRSSSLHAIHSLRLQ